MRSVVFTPLITLLSIEQSIVQKRQDLIAARQKPSEAEELVEDVELKEEFTESLEGTEEPLTTAVSENDLIRVKQSASPAARPKATVQVRYMLAVEV